MILPLTQVASHSTSASQQILEQIAPLLAPLGYEVIHVEIQTHKNRTLRVYIDRLPAGGDLIGVEDCAQVSRALDGFLESSTEIQLFFKGHYDLEVSSPGVFRPLRTAKDFTRFAGQEAKISLFRPLNAQELNNDDYAQRNPKQKNFSGKLLGFKNDRVLLEVLSGKPGKSHASLETVTIPLEVISKANLEPQFDFADDERKTRP